MRDSASRSPSWADKFLMSQQPALKYSWNTMVASSFWDMRLCAATDLEIQNRIILHDNTSTSMSWLGSPTLTPTTRHTRRRRASSPLLEGA